ncbi:MAG: tRNA-intron lyase [Candidatus Nezhaarchaeales archaeon]
MGKEEEKAEVKPIATALPVENGFLVKNRNEAKALHESGYFGEYTKDAELWLTDVEGLYLLEKGKIKVEDSRGNAISFNEAVKTLTIKDPQLWIKYLVFSDLRGRGNIVKPGFRKGVEYRVYKRGAEVGKEEAKCIVHGVTEGSSLDLQELLRLLREARNLRKELILAIVDRQGEVAYYGVESISL